MRVSAPVTVSPGDGGSFEHAQARSDPRASHADLANRTVHMAAEAAYEAVNFGCFPELQAH